MSTIHANIEHLLQRIEQATQASHRPVDSVRLLMATKTVPAVRIQEALATGQHLIGENKVQEVKEKFLELQPYPHESHFIGHLQTNKINELLKYDIRCIHSVDRLSLAQKLHERLMAQEKTIQILIQVNTSQEDTKYGCAPNEALALLEQCLSYHCLQPIGFMTIGANSPQEAVVRQCFKTLKQLQVQAQDRFGQAFPELSMGMSGDLEWAIAEGATIIRVGSAIFGQRQYLS